MTAPVATGRARADTVGGATAAGGEGEGRPWLTRQSSRFLRGLRRGLGGGGVDDFFLFVFSQLSLVSGLV